MRRAAPAASAPSQPQVLYRSLVSVGRCSIVAARIVIVITVPLSLSGVRMGTIVLKSKSCDSNPIVTLLRPMAAGQANQVRACSICARGSRVACRSLYQKTSMMCWSFFVFRCCFGCNALHAGAAVAVEQRLQPAPRHRRRFLRGARMTRDRQTVG